MSGFCGGKGRAPLPGQFLACLAFPDQERDPLHPSGRTYYFHHPKANALRAGLACRYQPHHR